MLKKTNYYLSLALYWSVVVSCALFVCVVLLGVLTRYVFKTPILGSVEFSRLFFLWSCFLAASLAYYQKAHISISFFSDLLPTSWLKATNIFGYGAQLLFFFVILIKSIEVVQVLWYTDLPMLNITQGWLYLPVPVAMFFMSLFCLEFFLDAFTTLPKDTEHALGTDH